MPKTVTIPRRFCGPPDSGNGGYSCGVVGALLDGTVEVTLRRPPPLDHPLAVERDEGRVSITLDGQLIAEAKPSTITIDAPEPPSFEEATDASTRFMWRETHPYPTCFVCGPKRLPGDGLGVFPGAVAGRKLAAAPFIPDATIADDEGLLRPELAWALLDCPSWFGFHVFNAFDGMSLLGRLTARIDRLPRVGDRCVAVGWSVGREGRKIHSGSALYSAAGDLLAIGQALWIVLK